ncbi:MAG: DUF4091 domain-containing protein, partial [Candidatus Pacebacteria bacterium]|nr:DUF4091 domain-containing protein [Candidatus Paceibacterota bacterium]
ANNRSGEIWGSFVAWYKQDKETARELLDKWTERRDEWIDIYNERPRFTLDTVPAWGEALRNKQSEGKQRAWYWHNQSAVALPALALRDYFWLMYRENVPNTLYWGAVMWCGGSEEFAFGPRRGWNERRVWRIEKGFGANRSTGAGVGNGILFWPGREGVLASMRLEIYRDGVEDFDLMKLLEKRIAQLEKAGGHADLIERARGVLSIPDDRILPSLDIYPVNWPLQNSHYYPDLPHQQAFEQHRRRIVTVLEETRKKLGIDK